MFCQYLYNSIKDMVGYEPLSQERRTPPMKGPKTIPNTTESHINHIRDIPKAYRSVDQDYTTESHRMPTT